MIGHRLNALQCADTIEARHVIVERDDIEFLDGEAFERSLSIFHRNDANALGTEAAFNEAPQSGIVVSV